ncbi:hypothetical protein I3F60_20660 [Streptomyces sp. MUM 136J]|uniref:hypothetical protein n=1 Tax=Streptomyces sp. MUM 136J TaxID=2791992 RepID=UPI001F039FFD|nr:hypothetical protein [Streptomyces sp. MUM 136J]MCH0571647.1 hypothetical protein [Streptomyces sp. MUM 136J]
MRVCARGAVLVVALMALLGLAARSQAGTRDSDLPVVYRSVPGAVASLAPRVQHSRR